MDLILSFILFLRRVGVGSVRRMAHKPTRPLN